MTFACRGLVAILALGAAAALDGPRTAQAVTGSPFDFTGHWTGVASENGADSPLTGDLSMVTTKAFTGTFTVEGSLAAQCTVKGHEKPNLKVRIRLACGGATIKVHGSVDPATSTVTGTYTRKGRHKVHQGTVTLTQQPT